MNNDISKNNRRRFGGLTLTKLNIFLWAVITIAVIVLVYRFCNDTEKEIAKIEVNDKIDVTPTIITAMKEIGEWEFLSVNDEELVDTVKKGFFTDDKLVRIYYGKLSLGINMHKAGPHWIRQHNDSIIITLPKIELLDNNFIDEARTNAFIEKGKWTDADREAMYNKAYRQMKQRCLTPQNISIAKSNATTQMEKMLNAMGIEKYRIDFSR